MSNINLIILEQTFLDRKIQNVEFQRRHLEQLMPSHKENLANQQNLNSTPVQQPKLYKLPTRKDLKMANHFDKMASRITNFSKPLI